MGRSLLSFSYVSAMVPVKSMKEYEIMQDVTVLFSETVSRSVLTFLPIDHEFAFICTIALICRALRLKLLTQDMIDDCDPALMFTIPRLAIVV